MDDKTNLKIGLALSGGGVRASVFHLGILSRLALDNLLEQITFISTVSGGSLVTGLIYSINDNKWPTSNEFLDKCILQCRYYLTQTDLQKEITKRTLLHPWSLLTGRANVVSQCMSKSWKIEANLNELPAEPRWIINATAYESGRNWRFIPQRRMGDYVLNYVRNPRIPLTDAMAASAAYPGLIGPFVLDASQYEWFEYQGENEIPATPKFGKLHLWDGGVYDNLGVEALFKLDQSSFREEFNFSIICDASYGTELLDCSPNLLKRANRLVLIAMDQVRGLRSRSIANHYRRNPNSGVYLKMGNSVQKILRGINVNGQSVETVCNNTLSDTQAKTAVMFPTTLRKITNDEFDLLYRHGWEVANSTLYLRNPGVFDYYDNVSVKMKENN